MERSGAGKALLMALLMAAATAACTKRDINPTSEVSGTVRWYAGVGVEELMVAVQQMFEAAGSRVVKVDRETGEIETDWAPEFDGSTHGWRLTRWRERQKFMAMVAQSQLQGEKGEPLVSVLLRVRWEERPPGGVWHVKGEGGAPSQSPMFQRFARELDERAAKLGARRN